MCHLLRIYFLRFLSAYKIENDLALIRLWISENLELLGKGGNVDLRIRYVGPRCKIESSCSVPLRLVGLCSGRPSFEVGDGSSQGVSVLCS